MLCHKILPLLDNDDVDGAFDELSGHLWEQSMQSSGCWAVQATLMAVSGIQWVVLIRNVSKLH
eukprot:12402857-Karenia_brevis.AAC.1